MHGTIEKLISEAPVHTPTKYVGMDHEQAVHLLESANSLYKGHFRLKSGRHTSHFFQKANFFSDPDFVSALSVKLNRLISKCITDGRIPPMTTVLAPAIGGVIPGFEAARYFGAKFIYIEKSGNSFHFRRGFRLDRNERVLIVDDVIHSGKSIISCIESIKQFDCQLVAAACLFDKSGMQVDIGIPVIAAASFHFDDYSSDDLPSALATVPVIEPGEHGLMYSPAAAPSLSVLKQSSLEVL